jgi:hypothetical protein
MKYAVCLLCVGMSLLAGCVAEPVPYYRVRRVVPGGLTTEEIVRMAKAGTSDAVIIEKIKTTGVAALPTADQLADLKKEGVSDAVLGAVTSAQVVEPSEQVETVYSYPYGYSTPAYYYAYGYPYYHGYGSYWYGTYGYRYPYYYGGYPSRYHTSGYYRGSAGVHAYRH